MDSHIKPKGSDLRTLLAGVYQVTLRQAIETFLTYEMIGMSDHTVQWYRKRLDRLSRDLGSHRLLSDLVEADLLMWCNELDKQNRRYIGGKARPEIEGGYSPFTKHSHIRACKRFFKWLHKKGVLPVNLAADLKLPRLPKRTKKGISDEAASKILTAAKDNVRDRALLRFIESTGIRRGGAAHLRLGDLDLYNADERLQRRATVLEKGNKERTVIMTHETVEALRAWLRVRPQINDDHVFLGRQPGKPWKPLSEDGITGVLRRYKQRLGITGRCSPHQWRHRWCRKRLSDGMPMGKVSQLAGHESTVVTDLFYGGFDIDDLQDAYDAHVKGAAAPETVNRRRMQKRIRRPKKR